MKNIIVKILTIISLIFLWPHLILYTLSKSKKEINKDTDRIIKKMNIRMNSTCSVIFIILINSYYRKLFYYRLGSISNLVSWYFPGNKSFFITNKSNIGGGIYLAHPFSTILNVRSIGCNFTCRQNTTCGNKFEGMVDSCPTIGDNVTLGANVCIIGDISIGNNVIVGAGSVVVKSIPDNVVIAGNPARIIKHLHQ